MLMATAHFFFLHIFSISTTIYLNFIFNHILYPCGVYVKFILKKRRSDSFLAYYHFCGFYVFYFYKLFI